ncbi:segregation and condensation protein A [Lacticaseibacillus jixianensis]|uniref:Segregation and condensation protein A n=1 Tax=Lacticaseibacillus jixianensis TaxID=2486012 RepID=A0ABW4B4Z8_9LACO|nr:segregation/condensation protein A [Lacticaseibacillus jixianensis]
MALTLVLNDFSGPLDLLWHLIRTNEVDIYDIPIAEITSQYLAYLHDMQTARLDVAGDYFVMAASLMAMKSKMLLPQPEPDPETAPDDYTDPRAGLVAQLLTYQVYQEAAAQLRERETARSQSYAKPESLPGAEVQVPMRPGSVKLHDITKAMAAVVARQLATKQTIAHIEGEPISVEKRITEVLAQLSKVGTCRFETLVAVQTVDGVVTTFLALLTLMKADQIICEQSSPFAPITVMKKEAA